MTRAILFLLPALLSVATACRKKADCNGTVLSNHFIPMSNQLVTIGYSQGGKNIDAGTYSLVTDNQGHFSFTKEIPKNQKLMDVTAISKDSGTCSIDWAGPNMRLVLH